jgi:hypothetical protein
MSEDSISAQYAIEYWRLNNAVTGFSIAQMIAYLLALGASDSKIRQGVIDSRVFVLIGIAIATIFYCGVVGILCQWQLDSVSQHGTEFSIRMWAITAFRITAIASISLLGFYVTWIIETLAPKT